MINHVQTFVNGLNERKHILLLVQNVELTICLFIEKEQEIIIFFHHGEACLLTDRSIIESNIKICGNKDSFQALMEGRETIRRLIKRGNLQVSAPFRTLLLLESLFYLGKMNTKIS